MEEVNNTINRTQHAFHSNKNNNDNKTSDVVTTTKQKRCCSSSSHQRCHPRGCCCCRCHHCCCHSHHHCHRDIDCNDNYTPNSSNSTNISNEKHRRRKRNLLSGDECSCHDGETGDGGKQSRRSPDLVNANVQKNGNKYCGSDDSDFTDVSEEDDVTNSNTNNTNKNERRRRLNNRVSFEDLSSKNSRARGYSPAPREAGSKEATPPPPSYAHWQRSQPVPELEEGSRLAAAFTKEETRRRRRRSSVMGSAHVKRKTSQWSLLNNVANNRSSSPQPGINTPGSNNTNNSGNISTTPTTSSTRYLMPTVGCHCTNCVRVFGNKNTHTTRKKSKTKQQQQLHQQLQLLLWQQQQIQHQHQQELDKQQQQLQPQLNRSFGVIDTSGGTDLPSRQVSEDSAVSVLTPDSFVPDTPDATVSSLQTPELAGSRESDAGKALSRSLRQPQAPQTVLCAQLPVSVNGSISISVEDGGDMPLQPEVTPGLSDTNESIPSPSAKASTPITSSGLTLSEASCPDQNIAEKDIFDQKTPESKSTPDVPTSFTVTSKTPELPSLQSQETRSPLPHAAEISLMDSVTSLGSTTTVTTTSPKSRDSPGLITRVFYTQPAASMSPVEAVNEHQDASKEEVHPLEEDVVMLSSQKKDVPSEQNDQTHLSTADSEDASPNVAVANTAEFDSKCRDKDGANSYYSTSKESAQSLALHSPTSYNLEVFSAIGNKSSETVQSIAASVDVDGHRTPRTKANNGGSSTSEISFVTSSGDFRDLDTLNPIRQLSVANSASPFEQQANDTTKNKFFSGVEMKSSTDSESEQCSVALPSSNQSDKVIYSKAYKKDFVVPKHSPKNTIGLFDLPLSRENILPLYRKTLSESNVFAKDHTNMEIRKLIANKAKLSNEAQSKTALPSLVGGQSVPGTGGVLGKHTSVVNVRYCEVNPFSWDVGSGGCVQEARQLKAGDDITHTEGSQKVGASMRVTGQDFSAHKSAVSEQQQRHTVTPAGTISEENSRRQSKSGLTITTKGVCTQQKSSMTSSQSNISYTGFEDFDLGSAMQPMDIQNAIMKYSGVMTKFVDQLKSMEVDSFVKAPNLLDHMNDMMKRAWSLPTYGHELGYSLCKVLKHNGGLDILLENCTSDNSNLKFSSAKVLEQCLTTENRGYVVEKGLENVVNVACDCTQENRTIDQSRVGTGILEHLFKHSEGTCSDIIKMGGLEAVVRECRKTDVETLRHCAGALANLSLYGGSENQQAMVQRKVAIWLFPLAFHHDDNIKYYACLAIAALVANTEIEAQVLKADTLSLIEPFVNSHLPEEFANSTVAHRHGQSRDWLERLVPVLSSKREEARNLAAFHFCMEAGIKKNQGNLEIFQEIDAIEPLKQVASSPNAIASKYAAHALRLMGEEVPHKLSQQVPLWQANDVQEWVKQIGFGQYANAFVTSRVDGDLLLQIGEENLQCDIGITNGILRQRFLRELRQLRQIADYSSKDPTGLNAFMTQLGQEYAEYTYKMLLCGASKSTLRFLSDEQLMTECGIFNSIHRQRLKEGVFDESSSLQDPNQLDKNLDVFISYRRSNGSQLASLLKVHMQLKGFSVFIDVERLEAGKFDNNLLSSIRQARNFLLVLTPNALDRCTGDIECKDWVHKEIVAALESGCNIIPIIDNFHWPEAEQLPEDMRAVCYFNGVRWIHDYQDACVDKLERFMRGEGSLRGEPPGSLGRYQSTSALTQPGTPSPLPRTQPIYQRTTSTESGKGSSCSDKDYPGKD